jgi:hypothetical protein
VFLGGEAGLGLEPVAEVRRPLSERPFLDRVRDFVRDRGIELAPAVDGLLSEPKIGLGSFFFMAATSNVLQPNRSRTLIPAAMSGNERIPRDATSPMAQSRPESSDIVHNLQLEDSIIGRRPAPQARLE